MKNNIKTIDLFAGMGGVRLGFEKNGFETVFANDFEPMCKTTYDLNFDMPYMTVEDVRKIKIKNLPDFDFLLGGFPCQAFSVAGHRKGFSDKGRGDLFFEIAKILEVKKPLGFFLENVKNLYGHDFGKTFKIILEKIDTLGYDVRHSILNTMEHGTLPQNRERIYIVGFRKNSGLINDFVFPKPRVLKKQIKDILQKPNEIADRYYYNDTPLFAKIKDYPFKTNRVYQWRRKYIRENKSGVCPTLTANMGMGGHNVPLVKDRKGVRKLTPRECARLQGFADNFKLPEVADSHLYKQIGNSVSVPVIKRVAYQIQKVI